MTASRSAHDEPIPGYRLIEPLGRGGFGEVWKCHAPGGLFKAIKFVHGGHGLDHAGSNAEQELRALEAVKTIRHPFLLSTERVEVVDGDLLIVMELADRSLHDLLVEYRDKGQIGIPRGELVRYLREAAEVLDLLNQEYGVKHLDVKPRNIFLVGSHVKVADFGLAGHLAEFAQVGGNGRSGRGLGGLTPLYAAPETFQGQVTLYSDQYSLAATYHELLTGSPVFKARNFQQMMMLVCQEPPDLGGLPPEDRPVVGRALAKDPSTRYPSCLAFIEELDLVTVPDAITVKAATTSYEFSLDDAATTPAVASNGSGVFRRKSRVLPAVRPVMPTTNESISGYQLLDSLGRGPTGELWRAKGPDGGLNLLRFITLPDGPDMPRAIDRLIRLAHPGLPRSRCLTAGPGRVALITDILGPTLLEQFRECQASGQPGLPRVDLLAVLGRCAQALDELYHEQQLQHLTLAPRQIVVPNSATQLLDFAQVELLWMPRGIQAAHLNPRYSAPELFEGLVSDACDQYSLALIYQELLVGLHPFRTLNSRQLASPKLRGTPDVGMLPSPDRPIILQALDPNPEKRFRSCREFILALEEATAAVIHGNSLPPSRGLAGPNVKTEEIATGSSEWRSALDELVVAACRGQELRNAGLSFYRLAPGNHLESRGAARLPGSMARLKLEGFQEQWKADMISREDRRFVFHIQARTSLWDRCLGRAPALQVEIRFGNAEAMNGLTPVRVNILPLDCSRSRAEELLAETAPNLLSNLQTYLHTQSDKTGQERYPLNQRLCLQPVGSFKSYDGQLRDIGRDGLCFYSAEPIAAGPASITICRWASPLTVIIPGRVMDCYPDEKRFEIEFRPG